jgi:predicted transcriptional regulator
MRAKKSPRPFLTRVETEIMRVLWAREPATVHAVVDELERPLAYTSVLTMLRVLEQKGYVTREANPDGGRAHVFRSAVSQNGVRRSHLRDLVDRFFAGQRDELMIGLLRDERWSRAELEALRDEIELRLESKKGGRG